MITTVAIYVLWNMSRIIEFKKVVLSSNKTQRELCQPWPGKGVNKFFMEREKAQKVGDKNFIIACFLLCKTVT